MSRASESQSMVVAVILAAGASRRLGRPKQLVPWEGETLLERATRIATEAGCTPVVVLGHLAEEIASTCGMVHRNIAVNPAWQQGMSSSIRVGIVTALSMGAEAALVMTCDQPAVTAEHLRRLMEAGAGVENVASAYAGRRGAPAYFPKSSFAALQTLQGDAGARDLLKHGPAIPLPFGELDIDTEEHLRLAKDILLQTQV